MRFSPYTHRLLCRKTIRTYHYSKNIINSTPNMVKINNHYKSLLTPSLAMITKRSAHQEQDGKKHNTNINGYLFVGGSVLVASFWVAYRIKQLQGEVSRAAIEMNNKVDKAVGTICVVVVVALIALL